MPDTTVTGLTFRWKVKNFVTKNLNPSLLLDIWLVWLRTWVLPCWLMMIKLKSQSETFAPEIFTQSVRKCLISVQGSEPRNNYYSYNTNFPGREIENKNWKQKSSEWGKITPFGEKGLQSVKQKIQETTIKKGKYHQKGTQSFYWPWLTSENPYFYVC